MAFKRIGNFNFREFAVVVGTDGKGFMAVAYDAKKIEIGRTTAGDRDEAESGIKRLLLQKSEDFVDFPSAMALFLRAFPLGFRDPFYDFDERVYKVKAHEKRDLLGKQELSRLIAEKDFVGVGDAARKVFTNLVFPQEAMAFRDFVRKGGANLEAFALGLFELLHSDDFDRAFDRIVNLLSESGAAKWPVISYWPFILFRTSTCS
jgi:hypothetical protein